jgi:threonylcarbamoyladenosine tRNA methylthiotransferase MtaB
MLLLQGVRLVDDPTEADTCYINTCTVTGGADRSSVQMIRRVCRLRPKPRVIVIGCLPQRSRERAAGIDGVDEVWDNPRKQAEISRGEVRSPKSEVRSREPDRRALAGGRSRALLKVQDGCSRRCSYCVVSSLRGEPMSVPADRAVEQFARLLESGFHEVVLTGLNVGAYRDEDGTTLAGLVRRLLPLCSDARIRIASIEPDGVNDELVEILRDERVCPHLHIPLQSGDDRILAVMHRPYSTSEYARMIGRVVAARPEVNVGADVIAGFPGEDDESFRRTRAFVAGLPIGYLHAFSFSLRPGTEERCPGPAVAHAAVKARVAELRALSESLHRGYFERFVGTVRSAIVETSRTALTDNYLRLNLRGTSGARPGSLIRVRVGPDQSGGPC